MTFTDIYEGINVDELADEVFDVINFENKAMDNVTSNWNIIMKTKSKTIIYQCTVFFSLSKQNRIYAVTCFNLRIYILILSVHQFFFILLYALYFVKDFT